jgi:glycosyltransferase involved in cell wall biosynthesis
MTLSYDEIEGDPFGVAYLRAEGAGRSAPRHAAAAAARWPALRATQERWRRTKLTVIVPCYNERNTVLQVIDRVRRLPIDKSIVVIDDGSTDGSRELLRQACCAGPAPELPASAARHEVLQGDGFVAVLRPRNTGKGACLRLGLELARSDYVICQDADLEYDPEDIVTLLEHAERTDAVAVFGSRLLRRPTLRRDLFGIGRVVLTKLFSFLYRVHVTDVATCYKLVRTEIARSLEMRASGFDLDFELAAKLRRRQHPIVELPVRYHPRSHAEGKKIRWRDGVSATWTLLALRLR